jgi:hypothetical protein
MHTWADNIVLMQRTTGFLTEAIRNFYKAAKEMILNEYAKI